MARFDSDSADSSGGATDVWDIADPTVVTSRESAAVAFVDARERRDLPANGAVVSRYVVTKPIGRGGMGVVFLAWDPTLNRSITLKLLHADRGRDASENAMLLREAQAMARLSHPNVVTVHDAGIFDERVFLAMEFVDGETLRTWMRAKERTWTDILEAFVEAGRGLAAAHSAGMVHRDFKPGNVMVGRDGRVRVTDFGLAFRPETEGVASDPSVSLGLDTSQERTRTGVLKGTPAYMAPEQFRGERADARSDQFSFCVALFEALYGVRPFDAEGIGQLRDAVLRGVPATPPPERSVPSAIHEVVSRGLRTDPTARFGTMADLLAALDGARRDVTDPARRERTDTETAVVTSAVGSAVIPATATNEPRPRSRWTRRNIVAVATAAGLGLVALAVRGRAPIPTDGAANAPPASAVVAPLGVGTTQTTEEPRVEEDASVATSASTDGGSSAEGRDGRRAEATTTSGATSASKAARRRRMPGTATPPPSKTPPGTPYDDAPIELTFGSK